MPYSLFPGSSTSTTVLTPLQNRVSYPEDNNMDYFVSLNNNTGPIVSNAPYLHGPLSPNDIPVSIPITTNQHIPSIASSKSYPIGAAEHTVFPSPAASTVTPSLDIMRQQQQQQQQQQHQQFPNLQPTPQIHAQQLQPMYHPQQLQQPISLQPSAGLRVDIPMHSHMGQQLHPVSVTESPESPLMQQYRNDHPDPYLLHSAPASSMPSMQYFPVSRMSHSPPPGSSSGYYASRRSWQPKKSTHNMIEKRYRTNLNDKIAALRDVIPAMRAAVQRMENPGAYPDEYQDDSSPNASNSGSFSAPSGLTSLSSATGEELHGLKPANKINKATILSKATEYITHLERRNRELAAENAVLKSQMEDLTTRSKATTNMNDNGSDHQPMGWS